MARAARGTSRSRARAAALAAAAATRLPERCDVCVIGGGASGLAAAIAAAEAGASVVVLERAPECGRTILATGNGRCNLMNAALRAPSPRFDRYNDPVFVSAVCGASFGDDVLAFFEGCGLAWATEDGGRIYPLSRQATSVREVLLSRARRAGVALAPGREVAGIRVRANGYLITLSAGSEIDPGKGVMAHCVVIASGGRGEIARSLGLDCAPGQPALCSLACESARGVDLAALDGRRAHVAATLLRDGSAIARERGEVLFRPYGISGIVTFDLSRHAQAGDVVSLDLTDGMGKERAQRLAQAGGLAGIVDPVIAEGLGGSLERLRDLRLTVMGPAEPERAQVTRGGLATTQFSALTLEAHYLPGLFACGEALDVDGACGGFNLAWAWKSGLVAGAAAAGVTR